MFGSSSGLGMLLVLQLKGLSGLAASPKGVFNFFETIDFIWLIFNLVVRNRWHSILVLIHEVHQIRVSLRVSFVGYRLLCLLQVPFALFLFIGCWAWRSLSLAFEPLNCAVEIRILTLVIDLQDDDSLVLPDGFVGRLHQR